MSSVKDVTKEEADEAIQAITNVTDAKLKRAFGTVPFVLVVLPTMDGQEMFSISGNLAPAISITFLKQAIDQHDHAKEEQRVNTKTYPALQ